MADINMDDGDALALQNKTPICFTLPGHTVDTSLQVFDQEFQVHSLMLKIGSRHFREFMDPPDETAAPIPTGWQYEFNTVVDIAEKTWKLEADSTTAEDHSSYFDSEYIDGEIEGFRRLLHCIYNQPFDFQDIEDLETLATLAETYGAGPAVSVSLDGALARSLEVVEEIRENALSYLKVAYRLRNRLLYKDSMVHVAGRWSLYSQDLSGVELPELRRCAIMANAGIAAMLDEANIIILKIIGYGRATSDLSYDHELEIRAQDLTISERFQYHTVLWQEQCCTTLASLYHALSEDAFAGASVNKNSRSAITARERIRDIVRPLLKNNPVLDRKGRVGEGDYRDCFLWQKYRMKTCHGMSRKQIGETALLRKLSTQFSTGPQGIERARLRALAIHFDFSISDMRIMGGPLYQKLPGF